MKPIKIQPVRGLRGAVTLPGDKSISHRAAILAAMAKGKTEIRNFLFADDCLVTLKALASLGVKVSVQKAKRCVTVVSQGSFEPPRRALDMGESGTSCRVLLGLLAGQMFSCELRGAASLSRRPMRRVVEPLRKMGARIETTVKDGEECLPIRVSPSFLHGINWMQKIPSAQVKSAVLLAGHYAKGETVVEEPVVSRDHTERMLKRFGAAVTIEGNRIRIRQGALKSPGKILVPGDISSAAFFIVGGLLVKNSKVLLKDVSINPTRSGILRVLQRMGGDIKIANKKDLFEPMADIEVASSELRATVVEPHEIPGLIDELPVLMVAASLAKGRTLIEGAGELRFKETDRINSMTSNLSKLGADIKVKSLHNNEVIEIRGIDSLKGAALKSFGDHRTAMSLIVAGLASRNACSLDDISCMAKSFPGFWTAMKHLFAK